MNKTTIILIFLLPLIGAASQYSSPESGYIGQYRNMVNDYQKLHNGKLPTKWSDMETLDVSTQLSILGGPKTNEKNLTDYYVILSEDKYISFDKGDLILVRKEPFDYAKWFSDFKSRQPDLQGDTANDEPTEDWIRWAVYRTPSGEIQTVGMKEDDFQKLINGTNFQIPDPEPYRFNLAQLGITDPEEQKKLFEPIGKNDSNTIAKDNEEALKAVTQPESITQPEKSSKSPPWWPWALFALVVVIVIIIATTRKQKHRQ